MEFDSRLLLFKEKPNTKGAPPHLFSDTYLNQLKSPSYRDQVTAEITAEETQVARSSAIRHQNVSIMALAGQEITVRDLEIKQFWESDPHPNLESNLIQNEFNVIGGKASFFGGEARLWQYLSETAKEIEQETKNPLNIYSLTPTEAVFLIKELVRRRLNYDDLIAGVVTQEKIDQNKIKTARPKILSHFSKNKNKYESKRANYITTVNLKKADKLISHSFVVCRHVAAISSILYEVLRSKQQNILMNGSYLIYHNEELGNQREKASVDMHSYNVLYTTRPTKTSPEVYLTVLDPTWVMKSNMDSSSDYTHQRVSQACSSLFEHGDFFNIPNTADTVQTLAVLALNRIKNASEPDVIFNDYISLEYQASNSDSIKALNKAYAYLVQCGNSRTDILIDLLQNPPAVYENLENLSSIRQDWLPGIIDQIEKLNIDPFEHEKNQELLDILGEHVSQITTDQLQRDKTGNLWKLLTAYQNLSRKL